MRCRARPTSFSCRILIWDVAAGSLIAECVDAEKRLKSTRHIGQMTWLPSSVSGSRVKCGGMLMLTGRTRLSAIFWPSTTHPCLCSGTQSLACHSGRYGPIHARFVHAWHDIDGQWRVLQHDNGGSVKATVFLSSHSTPLTPRALLSLATMRCAWRPSRWPPRRCWAL